MVFAATETGKISPSNHHSIGGEEFARGQVAGIPTPLAGDGLDLADKVIISRELFRA